MNATVSALNRSVPVESCQQAGGRASRHQRLWSQEGRPANCIGVFKAWILRRAIARRLPLPRRLQQAPKMQALASSRAGVAAAATAPRRGVVTRAVETQTPQLVVNGSTARGKVCSANQIGNGKLVGPCHACLSAANGPSDSSKHLPPAAPQPGVPEGTPVVSPLVRARLAARCPAPGRAVPKRGLVAGRWLLPVIRGLAAGPPLPWDAVGDCLADRRPQPPPPRSRPLGGSRASPPPPPPAPVPYPPAPHFPPAGPPQPPPPQPPQRDLPLRHAGDVALAQVGLTFRSCLVWGVVVPRGGGGSRR